MSATVVEQEVVSPQAIFEALQAFQVTAVLGSAIRLNVFDAIAAGHKSIDELAVAIGADQRGLAILMDALAAIGFVIAGEDGYGLTPVTAQFLVHDGGAYLGGIADVFFSDWQWAGHLALADAVRHGGVTSDEQNVERAQHPFWEVFVDGWTGASFPSAQAVAGILGAAAAGPLEILDVACGSGIYGATIAGNDPGSRVTFLDWPNVLRSTRGYAERFGVAERAAYLGDDMFQTPLGGPYDVAVASHVFHHFEPERCVALLRKIAAALSPSGRLAIHDFVQTSTSAQEPAAALFSVIMLVRTTRGRVYAYSDYQDMLAQAGFATPELHDIPGLPTRVLVAPVSA